LQDLTPRDSIPAMADDMMSPKATVALGVSLVIGLLFWAILLLVLIR
jgi:hypothetical protein